MKKFNADKAVKDYEEMKGLQYHEWPEYFADWLAEEIELLTQSDDQENPNKFIRCQRINQYLEDDR